MNKHFPLSPGTDQPEMGRGPEDSTTCVYAQVYHKTAQEWGIEDTNFGVL